MRARYADGRRAVFDDAEVTLGEDGLSIEANGARHAWTYAELRRGDDGAGSIILKRKPDTGERLVLDLDDGPLLRAQAPKLFSGRAQGMESPVVVASLAAAAWSLAAAFLIGVPYAADPLARIMPPHYREQIADVSWSQVNALTEYCDDSDEAAAILNDLALRIMQASDVADREMIWISVVDAGFPNAFALPDDSIIVTDELIAMAEHPDELTGVIAHEIAHIERNHVMKGVVRQIGAGIFFDVVFGGAGAGQAIAIASINLTGLRYSRDDETDADTRGLDYLANANIDPAPLAALFDRMRAQMQESGLEDIPTMLSSHPATTERAAAARARANPNASPSLNAEQWAVVRAACGGGELDDAAAEDEAAGATGED